MVWHIKKTSFITSRPVYYKGNNSWSETYVDRVTYTSQAKAKAEEQKYIWDKKDNSGWDVTAVNENA
tara:strand:+ start:195 stop:395 length:201 start_codon:yes stop_codon:yes gene_type:complete